MVVFTFIVCGGDLNATSERKTIYSHAKYSDQNYPNNARCEWTIKASPGAKVSLKFTTFDLEDGKDECGYVLKVKKVIFSGISFFLGGGSENVKIIVENGEKTTLNI